MTLSGSLRRFEGQRKIFQSLSCAEAYAVLRTEFKVTAGVQEPVRGDHPVSGRARSRAGRAAAGHLHVCSSCQAQERTQ